MSLTIKNKLIASMILIILMVILFGYLHDIDSGKSKKNELVGIGFENYPNLTGKNINIAILDTGVDKNHTDLEGRILYEACFSSTNKQYQGVCKSNKNEDFGENSSMPCEDDYDSCSHGTEVAGLVSGRFGIAPDSKIFSFQVYSKSGDKIVIQKQDYQKALLHILDLSQTQKIDIINLSFNTNYFSEKHCDDYDPEMFEIVQKLVNKNIIIVNSSGNNSLQKLALPSCLSNVISVGSIDNGIGETNFGEVSDFSNEVGILSTRTIGRYLTVSKSDEIHKNKTVISYGTSLSSGIASGVFALYKQKYPNLNQHELIKLLANLPNKNLMLNENFVPTKI